MHGIRCQQMRGVGCLGRQSLRACLWTCQSCQRLSRLSVIRWFRCRRKDCTSQFTFIDRSYGFIVIRHLIVVRTNATLFIQKPMVIRYWLVDCLVYSILVHNECLTNWHANWHANLVLDTHAGQVAFGIRQQQLLSLGTRLWQLPRVLERRGRVCDALFLSIDYQLTLIRMKWLHI